MTKAKQIKALKELLELEKSDKNPDEECIEALEEEIAKIEAYLKKEHQRIANYLTLISANREKRETAYENRKQIKAGKRESCKQRKLRLNRERRHKLQAA